MKPASGPSATTAILRDKLSLFMHCAFFLTGVAVLMLGPLLPLFTQHWQLRDSQGGLLLTAQFAGSFCGAVLLPQDLRKGLVIGIDCLAVGFIGLALSSYHASGFLLALASLLIGGFGIGQLINSISLVCARRSSQRRGAALMSLNLTWSAGALLAPLLVGLARGRLSLQAILTLFAAAAAALMLSQLFLASGLREASTLTVTTPERTSPSGILKGNRPLLLYYASLFFLYGAMENSITGWIATFSIRYAHTSASAGAYSATMLLAGITAGRTIALLLLRSFKEQSVQLASVVATIIATVLLHTASGAVSLLLVATALGLSLAPFNPVTSSLFLGGVRSTPRQAGFVMASAALGGAVLPLLVGIVSQQFGSLRFALELPPLVGLILLGLCLRTPRHSTGIC